MNSECGSKTKVPYFKRFPLLHSDFLLLTSFFRAIRILPVSIAQNIAHIRERIDAAARHAGRESSTVILMAVSKTFPAETIRQAYAAGIRIFGENRVQEFAGKIDAMRDLTDAEWHLVGHLQSNKATKATELFGAIDSVDSTKLAEKLNAAARAVGKILPVLIEVNIGGEAAKGGVAPHSEVSTKTGK